MSVPAGPPTAPASRAALTAAFLAVALTACAGPAPTPAPAPSSAPGSASATGSAPTAERAEFERLERTFDARLGLYAVDTATGREVAFRADERFGYASTHKAFSAAAVLQRTPTDRLDRVITYRPGDVVSDSPITSPHAGTGMTLRAIMDATLRYSDNTGGNLLFRELGGPAGLAAALRAVGDTTSRVDRIEPDLNRVAPGDLRDTSTPRALANTLRAFTLGDALTPDKKTVLIDMMRANTTGDADVRAGVAGAAGRAPSPAPGGNTAGVAGAAGRAPTPAPAGNTAGVAGAPGRAPSPAPGGNTAGIPAGWLVADKTGSADYGTRNDIAVVWPPNRPPIVIAVLTDRKAKDAKYDNRLLAQATTAALKALN